MNTRSISLFQISVLLTCSIAATVTAQEPSEKATPRLKLDAEGHTGLASRLFLADEDRTLITVGSDNTVRFWDIESQRSYQVLRLSPEALPVGIYSAALSEPRRMLAVSGATDKITLISLDKLEVDSVIQLPPETTENIPAMDYSSDGAALYVAKNSESAGEVLRLSADTGQVLSRFSADWDANSVAVSKNSDRIASCWGNGDCRIHEDDLSVLKTISKPETHPRTVAFIGSSNKVAVGWDDGSITIHDENGIETQGFSNPGRWIQRLSSDADGTRLAFTTGWKNREGPLCGMITLASPFSIVKFTKHTNLTTDTVFLSDSARVATLGGNSEIIVWNPTDGSQVQKLVGKGQAVLSAAWSSDGQSIAWGNTIKGSTLEASNPLERTFNISRLELSAKPDDKFSRALVQRAGTSLKSSGKTTVDVFRGGKKHQTLQFETEYERLYNTVNCFTLLPGDKAAVGSQFGLDLFDTGTGQQIGEFVGHIGDIWAVSPSPNGRYLLSASADMTLRVWDPNQDEPLLSLFFAGDEWVAWTPQGYYASSPGGEALMGWHLDNGPDKLGTFAAAAQFRESLYRPDVIKLLLRTGSVERALEAAGVKQQTDVASVLPPTVVITSPEGANITSDSAEITVRVVARQVGLHPITSMQLLLDGRPLNGKSGIKHFDTAQESIKERFDVPLNPGVPHRLQVRADSAVSYGLSDPVTVTFKQKSDSQQLPSLYVLAIGIKDYENDDLDLRFADADAKRLESTIKKHGKGLFRKVETKLMVNEEATQRGVLTGLEWLRRQMSQGDVGVVYFSGHGDVDATETFHLLPHDADTNLLKVTGVSDSMLKDMLKSIQGRLMVMLDACHSGNAFKNSGDFSDDLIRDLVSDDYGVVVMSSSKGRELSQESSDDGGGYFTIALEEGLSGKADTNNDGIVYSSELDTYVSDRVKELTKGNQHPVTRNPGGVSAFPLSKK